MTTERRRQKQKHLKRRRRRNKNKNSLFDQKQVHKVDESDRNE
jgi:hypothetical protein